MKELIQNCRTKFARDLSEIISDRSVIEEILENFDNYYQEVILFKDINEIVSSQDYNKISEEELNKLVANITLNTITFAILNLLVENLNFFFDKVKFKVDPIIDLKSSLMPKGLKIEKDTKNLITGLEIFVTIYLANKKNFTELYFSNDKFKSIYDSYPDNIKLIIEDFRERRFILNKISNAQNALIKTTFYVTPIGLGVIGLKKIFGKKKIKPIQFSQYGEFYLLLELIRYFLD
jgi:hypothetical protein